MTLAVMALYRRRHRRTPAQHRQLARQGNRPPRRDGHRAAQARRAASRKAPTSSRSRRPRHWRAAAIHTYDDHRMAMCFFAGRLQPAAGGTCRCASSTRTASAKTFPDYFETLFSVAPGRAASAIPVICDRRPHRLRQGHAGRARSPPRSATTTSIPARSTARPRSPRCAARRPTGRRGGARRAGRAPAAALRRRPRACSAAATSPTRSAPRRPAAAPRGSRPARGAHRPARRCSTASAACPAWWPTAATWAP